MDLKWMNEYRKEGKYTDFVICAGGKEFPVHRIILDKQSKYFQLLFNVDMKEKVNQRSEEKDVSADAVEVLLDYCYGEKLRLNWKNISDVLKISHRWMVMSAVASCEQHLTKSLRFEYSLQIRKLAMLYGFRQLEARSNLLIRNKLGMIATSCASKTGKNTELCEAIATFPVEEYSVSNFKTLLWQNIHIRSCKTCKTNLGKKLISVVNVTGIKRHRKNRVRESHMGWERVSQQPSRIDAEDWFFVQQIAKEFGDQNVRKKAVDFLSLNHTLLFTCSSILDVSEEDLVEYAKRINSSCSTREFAKIVAWFQIDAVRCDTFPKLFGDIKPEDDSNFLRSLRALKDDNASWLVGVNTWFFVRKLAEEYFCAEARNAVDRYVFENFTNLATKQEVSNLSFIEIYQYLVGAIESSGKEVSTERIWELWKTIQIWIQKMAKEELGHLLNLIPMKNVCYQFMKDEIVPNFVQEEADNSNTLCMLWEIIQNWLRSSMRRICDIDALLDIIPVEKAPLEFVRTDLILQLQKNDLLPHEKEKMPPVLWKIFKVWTENSFRNLSELNEILSALPMDKAPFIFLKNDVISKILKVKGDDPDLEKNKCSAIWDLYCKYLKGGERSIHDLEEMEDELPFSHTVLKSLEDAFLCLVTIKCESEAAKETRCRILWNFICKWRSGEMGSEDGFNRLLQLLPLEDADLAFLRNSVLPQLKTVVSKDHVTSVILDRAILLQKENSQLKL